MANAEHNHQVRNLDDLRVVHAMADGGPSLKRVQPRAMGRAFFIKHRTSHLTIAVSDEVNAVMGPVGRVPRGAAAPRPSPAPAATAPATAAAPPARRRSAGSPTGHPRPTSWPGQGERIGDGPEDTPDRLPARLHAYVESRWFATKDYANLLHEDVKIRRFIKDQLYHAGISRIDIERSANRARITIFTARPGIIIGRKGAEVEKLKNELQVRTGKEIYLNIEEVIHPELDAQLVAENVALQLQKRVAFRRAMKKAVTSALRLGADGIRIACAGRLGGGEIARREWYRDGRVPLHTIRADIDYGHATAHTTYGTIGVKVWIFKGEVLPAGQRAEKREGSAMLMPKRVKYRKAQRGRMTGTGPARGATLAFGEFGLKALEPGWVTNRQIEAGPRGAHPRLKRGGKVWIRVFPDKPVTKKPAETRMGKGKGEPRGVGGGGEAGPHPLRDGGRDRGHRARGVPDRGPEDRHRDAVHHPHAHPMITERA